MVRGRYSSRDSLAATNRTQLTVNAANITTDGDVYAGERQCQYKRPSITLK